MKPRKDYVKLNVDAAFDADLLQGAVGAVLRHCHGKFMAAANEKIEIRYDAFTAEARPLRLGMNLTHTVGLWDQYRSQLVARRSSLIPGSQSGSVTKMQHLTPERLSIKALIFQRFVSLELLFLYVKYNLGQEVILW